MTIKILKDDRKKREKEFVKEFNEHSVDFLAVQEDFGIAISKRGLRNILSSEYYTLTYDEKFDRFILDDCNVADLNKDLMSIFENMEEGVVIYDEVHGE